jgi:hypothetical protein
MKISMIIATLLLMCAPAFAQQPEVKSVFKEKLFWLNVGAVSGDCIASRVMIDGKRVREGNPLFADSNGTVNWPRAIAAKIAVVSIPALVYRFNPKWGRRLMATSAVMHFGAAGYTAVIGFKFRF